MIQRRDEWANARNKKAVYGKSARLRANRQDLNDAERLEAARTVMSSDLVNILHGVTGKVTIERVAYLIIENNNDGRQAALKRLGLRSIKITPEKARRHSIIPHAGNLLVEADPLLLKCQEVSLGLSKGQLAVELPIIAATLHLDLPPLGKSHHK